VICESGARRDSNVLGMRYRALACDYDGTLAHDGVISAPNIAALDRFRGSGVEDSGRCNDRAVVCAVPSAFAHLSLRSE